jgi:hypothetical protein
MKKNILPILFTLFLLVGFSTSIEAQNGFPPQHEKENKNFNGQKNFKNRFEEFYNMKREYLVKEVGMTKDEEEKFFPIYDELQKKKFEEQMNLRKKMKEVDHNKTGVSQQVYMDVADAMSNIKLKEAQLESEYFKKFKNILSPEKLFKFQHAEMRFNMEILKKKENKDRPEPKRK